MVQAPTFIIVVSVLVALVHGNKKKREIFTRPDGLPSR